MRFSGKATLSAAAALSLTMLGGAGTQAAAATTNEIPPAGAGSGSCDSLKRVLDGYRNASNPSMYAATFYLSAYIAAKVMNCPFVASGNPYHVKDTKPAPGPNYPRNPFGANFNLQTAADSTHKCSALTVSSGVYVKVGGDGKLRGQDNVGCGGGEATGDTEFAYQAIHEEATSGTVVNTRVILDNGSIRDLYRLVIMTGSHAGECVGIDDPNTPSPSLHAASCETNKTYFAPLSGEPRSGGDALDALWIEDGLQASGGIFKLSAMAQWFNMRHLGVLDLSGKSRAGDLTLYNWHGDWNQNFHYRPPGVPA